VAFQAAPRHDVRLMIELGAGKDSLLVLHRHDPDAGNHMTKLAFITRIAQRYAVFVAVAAQLSGVALPALLVKIEEFEMLAAGLVQMALQAFLLEIFAGQIIIHVVDMTEHQTAVIRRVVAGKFEFGVVVIKRTEIVAANAARVRHGGESCSSPQVVRMTGKARHLRGGKLGFGGFWALLFSGSINIMRREIKNLGALARRLVTTGTFAIEHGRKLLVAGCALLFKLGMLGRKRPAGNEAVVQKKRIKEKISPKRQTA